MANTLDFNRVVGTEEMEFYHTAFRRVITSSQSIKIIPHEYWVNKKQVVYLHTCETTAWRKCQVYDSIRNKGLERTIDKEWKKWRRYSGKERGVLPMLNPNFLSFIQLSLLFITIISDRRSVIDCDRRETMWKKVRFI